MTMMSTMMQAQRMLEADNQVGNERGGQQVRLATESPARRLAIDNNVDAKHQDKGESGDWIWSQTSSECRAHRSGYTCVYDHMRVHRTINKRV